MTRLIRFLLAGTLVFGGLAGLTSRATAQGTPLVVVPRQGDPNQLISFSFQQADIDDVLRFLADASGKIVFKDAGVTGSITIRNQSRIRVSEAIRLVGTILALKGFSLSEDETSITVVPKAQAIQISPTVTTGKDLASIPRGRQVITHIFPLENVDAVRL